MSLLIKEKGASREELKGFIEMHIEDILNAEDDDAIVDEFSQYLSVNEGDKKRMSEGVVKSIMQALRDDAKATDAEIKQYMTSLMKAGDEFDDIDDYVEDFKNYVADKALQEHFKRFK